MKRLVCLLLLVFAACSTPTPTVASQLNLDRPIDMAFACYGGLRLTNGSAADPTKDPDDLAVSAQPLESCDVRTGYAAPGDPSPTPPGQEDLTAAGGSAPAAVSYFGFILEPTLGVVAIASWDAKQSTAFAGGDVNVLDADPLAPGKNGITVGENPVGIATDKVGCFLLTANAGSCDMSSLDITSALDTTPGVTLDRLPVTNGSGQPMHAKPATMVGAPPEGTIGVACPQTATGYTYVAYPGCHLVAQIDVSTGQIVDGLQWDSTGVAGRIDPNTISCPDECDGQAPTAGIRPVALDLKRDVRTGRRVLAIGADNSNVVTLVDLDSNDRIASYFPIPFENTNGSLGITQVALSPQIGMGGTSGIIDDVNSPGGQFQFVYGVGTDRTVHVADILNLRKECDTQVDPRYLYKVANINLLSCMPVGDPATPPRRAGARGPGIELVANAVPMSVNVYRVDTFVGDTRLPGPTTMIGYYGVISTGDGASYIFNINDEYAADFPDPTLPIGTQPALTIAHQLRDALPGRNLLATTDGTNQTATVCSNLGPDPDAGLGNGDGARATASPTLVVPNGYVAAPKVGELPSIRQVLCSGTDATVPISELLFSAPQDVRLQEFPDLRGLRNDENWTLTWEGTLSQDTSGSSIDGPVIREAQMNVDSTGIHLDDATAPFCNAGVEPYDFVQLRGCDPTNGNGDCPVGYVCYVHPESTVSNLGACELADEADRLANACKGFLTSLRRYTVGKTASGELQLLPRKHELRTTPIDGCTTDQQCQDLASFAVQNPSSANPIDHTIMDTHHWTCQTDPDRRPGPKVCLQTCPSGQDSDCSAGTVCQSGYCMEGVEPPQSCVNAPQRYELHGGDAFVVIGSKTGYTHSIIADATGACVQDPTANPMLVGRIPLTAPACDPTADPLTGKRSDGTYDPDPCETQVMETDLAPNYVPGTCTLSNPATTIETRTATALRFRNRGMTLTIVDPTYPGDQTCIGDRMGGLGNVPLVADGYQITFRQTAGFTPLVLAASASLPIKIVHQPVTPSSTNTSEAFWVVDEGDLLSTSITAASTRGKVFRIESDALGTVNVLE